MSDLKQTIYNIFVNNSLLLNLFPWNKKEKPGKDIYMYTVVIQLIMIFYILFNYSNMQGANRDFTE